MSSPTRRAGAALVVGAASLVFCCISAVGFAAVANADTYRFWSYWHATSDSWTLAKKGPASTKPPDGTVEGWRFTKSTGGASTSANPRSEPDFERICADTPDRSGMKRVGVVIDYGTAKDAVQGEIPPVPRSGCAQVPPDATGAEVLAAVAEDQYDDNGLVCAIDGYPRGACAGAGSGSGSGDSKSSDEQPASPKASPTATAAAGGDGPSGDDRVAGSQESAGDGGLPLGAVIGVALGGLLIGVLGTAAVLRARRSS